MLNRVQIWEAAGATSAATSFFDPLVIDGKAFADGSINYGRRLHPFTALVTAGG
jgi:hypothetical protein